MSASSHDHAPAVAALILALAAFASGCNQSGAAPSQTDPPAAAASVSSGRTPVDNTGINVRDKSGATPTPMDQGNGTTDLAITQAIRKAVVADSTLSSDAKNCKIITTDQNVVLRGPVASAAERANIEAKAKAAANVKTVEDDLEVKQ